MNDDLRTISWVSWVHGGDSVALDDAAENFHEASRLYPDVVDPQAQGLRLLESSAAMRATVRRAVKRHAHLPSVALPAGDLGAATLASALAARRSSRAYGAGSLELGDLATILEAAYGVSHDPEGFRTVPSGGALYPLELYVLAASVRELSPAVYHFDPLRRALELLGPLPPVSTIAALSPYPELVEPAAAVIVVTAMFYRTRFKYGQRGYRFVLIEAGHAAQNALLAAAALGVPACPLGGFFDRRVDAVLGVDGLEEATVYVIATGARAG